MSQFVNVLGILWLSWLGVGTLAWTFQLWSGDTMGRWFLTILGWFCILCIGVEADSYKEQREMLEKSVKVAA